MILRKPYAFFIKNFRLIHLIMTIFIGYLIYKNTLIFNFLNSYITNIPIVVGQELTMELFNTLMLFIPFIIIISSIVILSVMYVKKKPFTLYIFIIIFYTGFIVFNTYLNNTIGNMELKILDIRIVRMARDLLLIVIFGQCTTLIFTFIRATGFDLKKFNFGKDLKELEIKQEDNEEFEVNIDLDTNKVHRKWNYYKRQIKYLYIEHKFIFNVSLIVGISFIIFTTYINLNVFKKNYSMGSLFRTSDFTIKIDSAFTTSKSYLLNDVTDKTLVIVKLTLKNNYDKNKKLDISRTELIINNYAYYHTKKYRDFLIDLGTSYDEQQITKDNSTYILVYEIPKSLKNANKKFSYVDSFNIVSGKLEPKTLDVKFVTKDVDNLKIKKNYSLNDAIDFNDSILKKSKLVINKFDINKTFALNYRLCVSNSECYNSVEYVTSKINTNYEKTLIKIGGEFVLGEKISDINNMYDFISKFGKLKYQIDDKTINTNILSQVKPVRVSSTDYYLEVSKDVEKASKIWLEFNIRDCQYIYDLK